MSVDNTLAERGARYGSFEEHAKISQGLLDVIRKLPSWEEKLEPDMRQAISTIFDKIARIMNGDPYYDDNWHDIQGYAKLVEDRIKKLAEKELFDREPEEELTDTERAADREYIQELRESFQFPEHKASIPENSESFKRWQDDRNNIALGRGHNPGSGYDG